MSATLFEALALPTTLAQSAYFLVSPWKPLFLLVTFVPWAWVITKVYDKHAARFFLPRRKWNIAHLCAGLLAVAAFVLMPVPGIGGFFAGWAAMLVILGVDLAAYPLVANKDERVPEKYRLRLNLASLRQDAASKEAAKAQAKVTLVIRSPDEKGKFVQAVPAPQVETPEYEVRAAAEKVITDAMERRSQEVIIGPASSGSGNQPETTYGVVYVIDGVKTPGETMPAQQAVRIMDFWKACAKLDVADRRRKLQGAVQVERDGFKHLLRVTSVGVRNGMTVAFLFEPEKAVLRKPDELGLLDMQMAELRSIIEEGKGVVLLGAPPDSGRTTLMYSVAQMHDAYTSNVQTVELEPQASIEGVRVNKFDPAKDGSEYSTLVRSVLRRDPQAVFVGELADANTAKEIAKADHERTRVYVSLRADNALVAIDQWVKAVGDPRAAANCLHGVAVGKVLRKLCVNCRVAYPPAPEMLKKMGVPPDKVQQLFKKGGQVLIKNKPEVCPVCQGVGYFGQEGVFEVYKIDAEERDVIATGNLKALPAVLKKRNQPTIQQSAIRKAIEGTTSIEEVTRITASGGGTPPAPPASSPKPQPVQA